MEPTSLGRKDSHGHLRSQPHPHPRVQLDPDLCHDVRLKTDGQAVEIPVRNATPALETRGRGTLWLGGGENADVDSGRGPILLLATGSADASDARAGATAYREGLADHGWTGDVQVLVHGTDPIRAADVARAAGVLEIGGDQSLMAQEVADATLRRELSKAVDPAMVSLGISELTALEVTRTGAVVSGERSAVTVDGSDADWLVGSNGAVNVWMDVAGPGDRVG